MIFFTLNIFKGFLTYIRVEEIILVWCYLYWGLVFLAKSKLTVHNM